MHWCEETGMFLSLMKQCFVSPVPLIPSWIDDLEISKLQRLSVMLRMKGIFREPWQNFTKSIIDHLACNTGGIEIRPYLMVAKIAFSCTIDQSLSHSSFLSFHGGAGLHNARNIFTFPMPCQLVFCTVKTLKRLTVLQIIPVKTVDVSNMDGYQDTSM